MRPQHSHRAAAVRRVIAANRMANEGKVHKAIRDAFDSIDTDKGGALSAVELAQMFQQQGVEVRRAHPRHTARAAGATDPSRRARRRARRTSRSWCASRRARTRTTTSRCWR